MDQWSNWMMPGGYPKRASIFRLNIHKAQPKRSAWNAFWVFAATSLIQTNWNSSKYIPQLLFKKEENEYAVHNNRDWDAAGFGVHKTGAQRVQSNNNNRGRFESKWNTISSSNNNNNTWYTKLGSVYLPGKMYLQTHFGDRTLVEGEMRWIGRPKDYQHQRAGFGEHSFGCATFVMFF